MCPKAGRPDEYLVTPKVYRHFDPPPESLETNEYISELQSAYTNDTNDAVSFKALIISGVFQPQGIFEENPPRCRPLLAHRFLEDFTGDNLSKLWITEAVSSMGNSKNYRQGRKLFI